MAWPEEGMEAVPACPLCADEHRALLHENLRDKIFFVAPGKWSLWRCGGCSCAYLDPRPNEETIGAAYENYYTHQEPADKNFLSGARKGLVSQLWQRLRNNYLNHRFGHDIRPSLWGGAYLVRNSNDLSGKAAHTIRHLPAPRKNSNRLLDIGCGNGDFLFVARRLGYRAQGLDIDPEAAEAGRSAGLDIRVGKVPESGLTREKFDQITLSHVIEHLHNPVSALREIHSLLKTGGRIWISCPNIDSEGHHLFADAWRGLEPPRHLVLFNFASLAGALARVGFNRIQLMPPPPEANFYWGQSVAISRGMDPYSFVLDPKSREFANAQRADRLAAHNPERGESITVIAYKEA